MPKRKPDDFFYAINHADTVVYTSAADFAAVWEPAGYAVLDDERIAPVQAHEFAAHGNDLGAVYAARKDAHGHARWPAPQEPPAA